MDEETIELLGAMFDEQLAGYDDDEDDDEIGYDIDDSGQTVGAFRLPTQFRKRRPRRRSRRPRRASPIARQMAIQALSTQHKKTNYMNAIQPAVPGVPSPGARNFPLGFGSVTFVNAGQTSFNLTANPQRPFKGHRLVIDVRRSSGATAELVEITQLNVGQGNQLMSAAALPAEAFRPDSFDTKLSLDPSTPGIDIVIGLQVSAAPGVADTITVGAMLIGDTIG
jgi:hypothetical protein